MKKINTSTHTKKIKLNAKVVRRIKSADKKEISAIRDAYKQETRNTDGSEKTQDAWMRSVLSDVSDAALYSTEIKDY